jgi:hypothetical protein
MKGKYAVTMIRPSCQKGHKYTYLKGNLKGTFE